MKQLKLKEFRKKAKLTQADVAAAMNISHILIKKGAAAPLLNFYI